MVPVDVFSAPCKARPLLEWGQRDAYRRLPRWPWQAPGRVGGLISSRNAWLLEPSIGHHSEFSLCDGSSFPPATSPVVWLQRWDITLSDTLSNLVTSRCGCPISIFPIILPRAMSSRWCLVAIGYFILSINLGVHDGRIHFRRRPQERSHQDCIVERHTARTPGFMVWGGISYESRTPLIFIQGTMTAQIYIADVLQIGPPIPGSRSQIMIPKSRDSARKIPGLLLQPVVLPFLEQTDNAIFQQDNARPHTANISRAFLKNVDILPWPSCSPDLSPIEHVWDMMGREI
ncbi:hypothetical protein LAZ67_7000966 [Cordylochernes scorpioides]|uniref:Tc1-like transposase DDE domain-containing protein n=1 Tax=Cordylochernes scorpioides TaxID=51811 RepID=A0ABY6KLX4_9ARAC|nr:hypothetical protein LAZ67_7000966 [Cordylochernes scorpioides]